MTATLAAVDDAGPGTDTGGFGVGAVRVGDGFTLDTTGWAGWLSGQRDPDWRAGEWEPRWWLFTGDPDNPATRILRCRTAACPVLIRGGQGRFCRGCTEALAASGRDRHEFAATHTPAPPRTGAPRPDCRVRRDGIGCPRPAAHLGLCGAHSSLWGNLDRRRRLDQTGQAEAAIGLEEWIAAHAVPYPDPAPPCPVGGCAGAAMNQRGLCDYHWRIWRRSLREHPDREQHPERGPARRLPDAAAAARWAAGQTPFLTANRFSLLPLPALLRAEVLFALQRLDRLGRVLDPYYLRVIVCGLADAGTATLLDDTAQATPLRTRDRNIAAVLSGLCWAVRTGFDEFTGVAPADKPVLDLRLVGVRSDYTTTRLRRRGGTADLTAITQDWLRALLVGWVELEQPASGAFTQTLRAVRFASHALAARPGGGHDPAELRFTDMAAVIAHIWAQTRPDGRPYSFSTPRNWQWKLFQLLDYGARAGLLDTLSAAFTRHRIEHNRRRVDPNEAQLGKAIPEPVIAQLDAQLHRLGLGPVRGSDALPAADLAALYQTAYLLLRDTGRRPNEIAALPRDCLEHDGGEITLIWHNRKSARLRRRLPITTDTAQTIQSWQHRRDQLTGLPARGERFLFPAFTTGTRHDHIPTEYLWAAIRRWVDDLPQLHGEGVDAHGERLTFDRTRIYPYAFRHSYAQRHADAGTPVDVLRDLMDHMSAATTQGYYTVSIARRRAAVTTLAAHVIDRHGRPEPSSATAYEMRSVAVPFGGCTEPANVKAGGKACPIRFQCAGCGFYRPDPSYLTAIEHHLAELRAGRETAQAMDTAEFVLASMTEEIAAYEAVAATMRTRLAELPADERAEIEQAATALRKIRAGQPLPLTVLTPTPAPESAR